MPKRDVEGFLTHWSGATVSERAISRQFLCELLDVPQPGNQRNGSLTFEFHIREPLHDGTSKEGRINLYKRGCFVLESKKFQEAAPDPSPLELAAQQMGATSRQKKSAAPVRNTERWDDAMLQALGQTSVTPAPCLPRNRIRASSSWSMSGTPSKSTPISRSRAAPAAFPRSAFLAHPP